MERKLSSTSTVSSSPGVLNVMEPGRSESLKAGSESQSNKSILSQSLKRIPESSYSHLSEPRLSVLREVEILLEAIRARQPGIHNREAKKLQSKFARELSLYFRRLSRNIPYKDLPGYLDRNGLKEAITPDEESLRIAGNVTEELNQRLGSILRRNLENGYLLGATQAHQVFRLEPTFELLDAGAVDWMNAHAARLVTSINATTKAELATVLTRGAQKGESVARLAKNIRANVAGMADITKGRAHLIANTELNEAMSEASLQTYKRLNVAGKSWSTVGDDRVSDECQSNQGAGTIPLEASFPSGMQRPPQHPGCRCTLVPERKGKQSPFEQEPGDTGSYADIQTTKSEGDRLITKEWAEKNVIHTPQRDRKSVV